MKLKSNQFQNDDKLTNRFKSSDINGKYLILEDLIETDIHFSKKLIKLYSQQILEQIDECSSLEKTFSLLILLNQIDKNISKSILRSIFSPQIDEDAEYLHRRCLEILNRYSLKLFDDLDELVNYLKLEPDERKLALALTDLVILNESLANKIMWLFFENFAKCDIPRYFDCLRILNWSKDSNKDLIRIISIAAIKKIINLNSLEEILQFLELAKNIDYHSISLLISDSKEILSHTIDLINRATKLDILLGTFIILRQYKPDFLTLIVTSSKLNLANIVRCINNETNILLISDLLDFISKYPNSMLTQILSWWSFPKELIIDLLNKNQKLDLFIISNILKSFHNLKSEFAEQLITHINPHWFSEQLLNSDDINGIAQLVIQVAQIKPEFLNYSLKNKFSKFIQNLDSLLLNIDDLELLADFTNTIHENFSMDSQFPLFLTIIAKKLQREQDLDNLGIFIGILGQKNPQALQNISLHKSLLPIFRLFPTHKLGNLIMTTALYDEKTAIKLGEILSQRLSHEPDLNLVRSAFGSIILGSSEVAKQILENESFDVMKIVNRLNPDFRNPALISMILETFHTVTNRFEIAFLSQNKFQKDFVDQVHSCSAPDLVKIIANSNWIPESLQIDIAKQLSNRYTPFTISELIEVFKTGIWANPLFALHILQFQKIDELGEKLSLLEDDPNVEEIMHLINELSPDYGFQIYNDYFSDEFKGN